MNMQEERKKPQAKVTIIRYKDNDKKIFLTTYADTVVFDQNSQKICWQVSGLEAIRSRRATMAETIYGGGTIQAVIGNEPCVLNCAVK